MQRLCSVYGDRAVEVFFRRLFTAFFGLLFGVEALPIHDCGAVDIHTLIDFTEQQQQQKQQQHKFRPVRDLGFAMLLS